MADATGDTTDEPNFDHFAGAIIEAGLHDGGTFRMTADESELHVGILPGDEGRADELAAEHNLELDRAELTRRVYVPEVQD